MMNDAYLCPPDYLGLCPKNPGFAIYHVFIYFQAIFPFDGSNFAAGKSFAQDRNSENIVIKKNKNVFFILNELLTLKIAYNISFVKFGNRKPLSKGEDWRISAFLQ